MIGVVFMETLRRKWRQMIYWGLGVSLWGVTPFFMLPSNPVKLDEMMQQYTGIAENWGSLMQAVGLSDAAMLGTPKGFVGYYLFSFMLLILAIYAVLAGLNVTANEEEDGAMDVLLSLPIPRWRLVVEKVLAYSVMIVGILILGSVGMLIGVAFSTIDLEVSAARLLAGMFNILPGTLLILTFTALMGALLRRRSTAIAASSLFVVAGYLFDAIGRASGKELMDHLRQITVFAHYNGTSILLTGLNWNDVIGLLVVSVLLLVGAILFFERRDIAV